VDPLEQVLSELDAAFGSALERQESDAADDLALSLKQDSDLFQTIADGSAIAVLIEGECRPVGTIGADHVVVEPGPCLVPLSCALMLKSTTGQAPRLTSITLLEALRARARRGPTVTCAIGDAEVVGRLAMCGRDHVVVARSGEQLIVPLSTMLWIRFSPEDSTDLAYDQRAGRGYLDSRTRSTSCDRFGRAVDGVRNRGVLNTSGQHGSSTVESVFSIVFLLLLVLGSIEISFALYSRNVVMTSAHEGARAALEIGTDPETANALATRTIRKAAGNLVRDLRVQTRSELVGSFRRVRVVVTGRMAPFGPVPIPIPLSATATAVQEIPRR